MECTPTTSLQRAFPARRSARRSLRGRSSRGSASGPRSSRRPTMLVRRGRSLPPEQLAGAPAELGRLLQPIAGDGLKLGSISNRGIEVWPGGFPETFCTDHWRCRFLSDGAPTVAHAQIASLLARLAAAGLDFVKTENLCSFDGQ